MMNLCNFSEISIMSRFSKFVILEIMLGEASLRKWTMVYKVFRVIFEDFLIQESHGGTSVHSIMYHSVHNPIFASE
jgi:hypothetical protein